MASWLIIACGMAPSVGAAIGIIITWAYLRHVLRNHHPGI
jgi:hypothetical protein